MDEERVTILEWVLFIGAWIILLLFILTAAGCATTMGPAPKIQTQVVKEAVATSCIPKDMPAAVRVPFSKADLLKAGEPSELMKELYADLKVIWPRLDLDEGVINACR